MISDLAVLIGHTEETVFTYFNSKATWSEGKQQNEYQKHPIDCKIVNKVKIVEKWNIRPKSTGTKKRNEGASLLKEF